MEPVHDKGVHGPGPWTRSTEGVHGSGVHVLYSPGETGVERLVIHVTAYMIKI